MLVVCKQAYCGFDHVSYLVAGVCGEIPRSGGLTSREGGAGGLDLLDLAVSWLGSTKMYWYSGRMDSTAS